jgi:hypothetical protein
MYVVIEFVGHINMFMIHYFRNNNLSRECENDSTSMQTV